MSNAACKKLLGTFRNLSLHVFRMFPCQDRDWAEHMQHSPLDSTSTFACICCSRNELVKERIPFPGNFEKIFFKKSRKE